MKFPVRESRTKTIHVRVDPALHREAEKAAAKAGISLSDLVRAGLKNAVVAVWNEAYDVNRQV